MNISAPVKGEYPDYYVTYISKVTDTDLIAALRNSEKNFDTFIRNIPQAKLEHRYAPGKWTIKDIVQHVIDTERVFAYRAMRFARNDKTELPGFNENDYTPEANANHRSMDSLLQEYAAVRQGTIALFNSFTGEIPDRKGIAANKQISVRALGFIIAGHTIHHQQVIAEKYL